MDNEGLQLNARESVLMKDCLLDLLDPKERAQGERPLRSL